MKAAHVDLSATCEVYGRTLLHYLARRGILRKVLKGLSDGTDAASAGALQRLRHLLEVSGSMWRLNEMDCMLSGGWMSGWFILKPLSHRACSNYLHRSLCTYDNIVPIVRVGK